jgi:hypothetical protein
MPLRFTPALASAAWLAATTAMAQVPPSSPAQSATTSSAQAQAAPTSVSPLIVQAPASRAVLEQQAHGFVQSHAAPTLKLGQFARWYDPACVMVTGLIAEQAAQFRTRVENVAKAVGERVAPSGCRPNIEIVFTTAPQPYIDAVAARSAEILGYGGVKTITRPIQAWYDTTTLGQPAPARGSELRTFEPPPRATPDFASSLTARANSAKIAERAVENRGHLAPMRCVDTRSPTCPHSGFLNVLEIVDAGHMGDVSVDVTADYIAMLALSQPLSLDGCAALPSVIDLYAGGCSSRAPPSGLTPADMAYLTSLYAADLTVEKSSEQSDIAGRMVKILATAKEPAR